MTIEQAIQQQATGKKTDGTLIHWNLSKDISIEAGKLIHKGRTVFAEIDEVYRVITVDRRKALESGGRRNPFLSHTALAPSCTYKVQDAANYHEFKTDSLGRVVATYHKPVTIFNDRLNDEQTKALLCKDEQTTPNTPKQVNDEGGHILASSAGGIPESINIFPQAYAVNHSVEWRNMERLIVEKVRAGETVEVKTVFEYEGSCLRPKMYQYFFYEKKYKFNNKNII